MNFNQVNSGKETPILWLLTSCFFINLSCSVLKCPCSIFCIEKSDKGFAISLWLSDVISACWDMRTMFRMPSAICCVMLSGQSGLVPPHFEKFIIFPPPRAYRAPQLGRFSNLTVNLKTVFSFHK